MPIAGACNMAAGTAGDLCGRVPVAARTQVRACCRIAENIYAIEHDDATDEWPHGNTGVIVGRKRRLRHRLLLPSVARKGRHRAHRPVIDKPVRSLLTTHWHFDHNNGPSPTAMPFRRDADRRTQDGALDRAQPDLLEGALDGARLHAARGARDAGSGACARHERRRQSIRCGRAGKAVRRHR